MQHLIQLHATLIFTILLVFASLAIWALIDYLRKRDVSAYVPTLLIIGELLIMSTFGIGVILWFGSLRPSRPEAHLMYAGVAAVSPLVMLADLRRNSERSAQLRLCLGSIFVCAIVLRGLVTGR